MAETELQIAEQISKQLINDFFNVFGFPTPLYNMVIDYDAFYEEGKVLVEIYLENENFKTN